MIERQFIKNFTYTTSIYSSILIPHYRHPKIIMEAEISIFNLNCWGLGLGISKDRDERMEDIGRYLAEQDYDIVFLQEVWKRANYLTIKNLLTPKFPHSQYFDHGIIGTGTVIFTKVKINVATFHEFAVNGYPHKLLHGDWFGGKGLGICQIDYLGFNIHLFVSHYHANYSPSNDVYLSHRVVHSVESAHWIKLSSSGADLTIYAGDLNTEPAEVPYKIVRYVTPLRDAWVEANGEEGGETSETPNNSYTARTALRDCPAGRRIDYILYSPGPNIQAETVACVLPLRDRIPGKNISFSDHEAVAAKLRVTRKTESPGMTSRDYIRLQSVRDLGEKLECVDQAKDILRASLKSAGHRRNFYLLAAALCFLLLILAFVPVIEYGDYVALDVVLFILRLILVVVSVYLFLMSVLFFRKECHALRGTLASLEVITERGREGMTEIRIDFDPEP